MDAIRYGYFAYFCHDEFFFRFSRWKKIENWEVFMKRKKTWIICICSRDGGDGEFMNDEEMKYNGWIYLEKIFSMSLNDEIRKYFELFFVLAVSSP